MYSESKQVWCLTYSGAVLPAGLQLSKNIALELVQASARLAKMQGGLEALGTETAPAVPSWSVMLI